jgi:putative phosphoribosyl transferase
VLRCVLAVPAAEAGLVVLLHDSPLGRTGSLARALFRSGLATLGLLTHAEAVQALAEEMIEAIDWLPYEAVTGDLPPELARRPVGCFGGGAAGAAALIAAAERSDRVAAVVCVAGRPDRAGEALARVTAPTLLVAAADDRRGVEANRHALAVLAGESRLRLIPESLEDDAALELTREWFLRFLSAAVD